MKEGIIRPLALCIIRHGSKLLVMDGYDKKEDKAFYRILGGGIEVGEYALDALKREFKEELNVELKNVVQLDVTENIFNLNGKLGHEIVFLFEAELADDSLNDMESIQILDSENKAWWKESAEFKENKLILYPENIIQYI